jgi:hypothetical protein
VVKEGTLSGLAASPLRFLLVHGLILWGGFYMLDASIRDSFAILEVSLPKLVVILLMASLLGFGLAGQFAARKSTARFNHFLLFFGAFLCIYVAFLNIALHTFSTAEAVKESRERLGMLPLVLMLSIAGGYLASGFVGRSDEEGDYVLTRKQRESLSYLDKLGRDGEQGSPKRNDGGSGPTT